MFELSTPSENRCAACGRHDDDNSQQHLPRANETLQRSSIISCPSHFFQLTSHIDHLQRYTAMHPQTMPRTSITSHQTTSHPTQSQKHNPSRTSSTTHASIKPQRSLSATVQSRDTLTPEFLRGLSRPEYHAFQRTPSAKASCPYAWLLLLRVCQRGGCRSGLAGQNMKTCVWDAWDAGGVLLGCVVVVGSVIHVRFPLSHDQHA